MSFVLWIFLTTRDRLSRHPIESAATEVFDFVVYLDKLSKPPYSLRRMMIEGGPTLLRGALESHFSSPTKFITRVIVTISPVLVRAIINRNPLVSSTCLRKLVNGHYFRANIMKYRTRFHINGCGILTAINIDDYK